MVDKVSDDFSVTNTGFILLFSALVFSPSFRLESAVMPLLTVLVIFLSASKCRLTITFVDLLLIITLFYPLVFWLDWLSFNSHAAFIFFVIVLIGSKDMFGGLRIETIYNISLIIQTFFLLDLLYQYNYGVDFFGFGLMNGYKLTGPYPSTYVDTLAIIFIISNIIIFSFMRKNNLLLYAISWFLVQLYCGSRSAILIIPSMYLIYYIYNLRFIRIVQIILISSVFIFFLYYFGIISDILVGKFMILLNPEAVRYGDSSASIRWATWEYNIAIINDNIYSFIYGHGFGSFPSFDIYNSRPHQTVDAQNALLDLINSIGIVGLVLFVISIYKSSAIEKDENSVHYFVGFFWFLSPFSVQHRFEAAWFLCQILAGYMLLKAIQKSIKRKSL